MDVDHLQLTFHNLGPNYSNRVAAIASTGAVASALIKPCPGGIAVGNLVTNGTFPYRTRYAAVLVILRAAITVSTVLDKPLLCTTVFKGIRSVLRRHGFEHELGVWTRKPGMDWAVPVLRGNKNPRGQSPSPGGHPTTATGEQPSSLAKVSMGPRPRSRKRGKR